MLRMIRVRSGGSAPGTTIESLTSRCQLFTSATGRHAQTLGGSPPKSVPPTAMNHAGAPVVDLVDEDLAFFGRHFVAESIPEGSCRGNCGG